MAYIIQYKTGEKGARYEQFPGSGCQTREACLKLLQSIVCSNTCTKVSDDTYRVDHEYYGIEWYTLFRIREVK